jgi:hypothetical protein
VTPIIQKRIVTLEDAPAMAGFFFKDEVQPTPEDLTGQKKTPAAQSAQAARLVAGDPGKAARDHPRNRRTAAAQPG